MDGRDRVGGERGAGRQTRRDVAAGAAMVLGTTLVVSPLVMLQPQHGGWFALLYRVPILWGSTNRGPHGGVLAASGSVVVYLVVSAVNTVILSSKMGHEEVLGQFIGLAISNRELFVSEDLSSDQRIEATMRPRLAQAGSNRWFRLQSCSRSRRSAPSTWPTAPRGPWRRKTFLKRYQIHGLKIDRSFVGDTERRPESCNRSRHGATGP